MRQLTDEDRARLSKLGKEYSAKKNELIGARFNALSQKAKDFLQSINYNHEKSELYLSFVQHISEGKEPSVFIKENLPELLNGYVDPRHERHLFYAMDHLYERPYQEGYYRRPLRTTNAWVIAEKEVELIKEFWEKDYVSGDICDYLEEKISDEELGAKIYGAFRYGDCIEEIIAAEIDFGNERLITLLTESLNGENEVAIERAFFKAIVKSHNHDLYELLGKLLVAAGLQEGLRQSICETMDDGTKEAFIYLCKIIVDNNFIRFSSVKRAYFVWLGFGYVESKKLERVSERLDEYVIECLTDDKKREEYLSTEDSIKIHVALWSLGFYDIDRAKEAILDIVKNGSIHQLLVAREALVLADNRAFSKEISKPIIRKYHDDLELMAGYISCFLDSVLYRVETFEYTYDKYFESMEEAEEFYQLLKGIYDSIPGKKVTYDPFVHPWIRRELSKSIVLLKLSCIAKMIGKDEKIDEVCKLLKDADGNDRPTIIKILLSDPKTKLQRETLINAICDKAEYARGSAFMIVDKIKDSFTLEDYLIMESLLKYKAAESREKLISLLMEQEDKQLLETIGRLVTDKKEEKRTAGLDMIIGLSKDPQRKDAFEKGKELALKMDNPSTKEKILLDSLGLEGESDSSDKPKPLFTDKDVYAPRELDEELSRKCVRVLMEYFPDSEIGKTLYPDEYRKGVLGKLKNAVLSKETCTSYEETMTAAKAFGEFIRLHEKDEIINAFGEKDIVGCKIYRFVSNWNEDAGLPCEKLWEEYIRNNLTDKYLFYRVMVATFSLEDDIHGFSITSGIADKLYGKGFSNEPGCAYPNHVRTILSHFVGAYIPSEDRQAIGIAQALYFEKAVSADELYVCCKDKSDWNKYYKTIENPRVKISEIDRLDKDTMHLTFPLISRLFEKYVEACPYKNEKEGFYGGRYHYGPSYPDYLSYNPMVLVYANYYGFISKAAMYKLLLDESNIKNTFVFLTNAIKVIKDVEKDGLLENKGTNYWQRRVIREVGNINNNAILEHIAGVYEAVMESVLYVELHRGDSSTEYSKYISSISRIYGTRTFVDILAALGKDTLERSSYYSTESKKGALSQLLSVCVPDENDNADTLREALAGTDITDSRLVEASLYSPEWLDIVEDYLGWDGYASGCYYFIAHMNETFDNRKTAMIAKFTPLSTEELRDGAFDIEWFKGVYEKLGDKRFDMIYKAAKYISDGSKHTRARKYADAALGKLEITELEETISDKRNKDLLMAYPLIPIKDEDDICRRYLYIQKFLKESKQFGPQRRASEALVVDMAMRNLSLNAGFSDTMRLILRMETKLMEDARELFEEKEIENVTVKLVTDDFGNTDICVVKAGKTLKSVPAALKKNEYIKTLIEAKKKFADQLKRTKAMFEHAMEDGEIYTVGELALLKENKVVYPVIKNLVFATAKDNKTGFLDGNVLTDYAGNEIKLPDKEEVIVAHPFHIYKEGHWADYQKKVFDEQRVQPFKQVFRELYVKTDEEMETFMSRRYSGNQIQPAKTVATLKSRRWVCDIEDGLQKVYYKENIVATIYAMADWFSPSDVEAPTLEWVAFYDRKTGKKKLIKDIPDVLFSEVMRDVDLAVSVAHAGGVDPQTSHSTIEMRAALLEFTLPLFKLTNVTIEKSHAFIEGKYGKYSVQLGSGVIHKIGGTMINILPVHSQHRGKLFLPFADEDPKTAEILTKVLFLAEDSKIKDPSIIGQIR